MSATTYWLLTAVPATKYLLYSSTCYSLFDSYNIITSTWYIVVASDRVALKQRRDVVLVQERSHLPCMRVALLKGQNYKMTLGK